MSDATWHWAASQHPAANGWVRPSFTSDNHPLLGVTAADVAPSGVGALQSIATGSALQSIAIRPDASGPRSPVVSAAVARYLTTSTAAATSRAYRGDVGDFLRWGGRIPCTPIMLVEYIAERAQVHCPSTVARRVVGIGRAHVAHGIPDPSKDELVRRVLRGVRRAHGTGQRQAAPLLMEDLLAGISRLPDDLRGARDRALLLIGFAAGMRRSELVGLDVEDLAFVDAGVFIRLRRSKTDQEGCGRTIAIPYGRTAACPVLALKHWLAVIGIRSGAVFLALNRGNALPGHRLGDQSVSRVVKEFVLLLGKAPAAYSGHSLRAGFVTSAAQAGADFLMIQQQTGHRSIAMLSRYLRTVNPFEGNAARGLL